MLILIQWALYSKQYKTVKFLTLAGSDADYKSVSHVLLDLSKRLTIEKTDSKDR